MPEPTGNDDNTDHKVTDMISSRAHDAINQLSATAADLEARLRQAAGTDQCLLLRRIGRALEKGKLALPQRTQGGIDLIEAGRGPAQQPPGVDSGCHRHGAEAELRSVVLERDHPPLVGRIERHVHGQCRFAGASTAPEYAHRSGLDACAAHGCVNVG